MGHASDTGGVKPMSIAGRLVSERERLVGMTDAERAFRAQWLKDQHLSPNEPYFVPEMYKETHNPIRRFYRAPLDKFRTMIEPMVGADRALKIRYFTGKFFMLAAFGYGATYYFKYNGHDWTKKGGWNVVQSRKSVLEGDPGYPQVSDRSKGSDYSDRGFKEGSKNLTM